MATPVKARAQDAARSAEADARAHAQRGSGWYAVLARSGLAAKGASYGLVGALAIKLAVGDGGKATSRQGALQALAEHTFGQVVLALLAFGLAGYAVWRFVEAAAERDEDGDEKGKLKTWGKRAGYVGRGLIYASLTFSALKILFGGAGSQSQNAKAHQTTATLFGWPGGRWLVGAAGLVIIGVGLWNVYRGLSKKFEDKWQTGGMSAEARTWGGRIGVAGHLARGVVFGLIGIFVIKAAVDYDPKDAIGLDGALRKLADGAYGPYLLGVTAAGLVCYGLYCLVDARYRDISTAG
jgi:Domain of Unknown Function (DUF1206)